MDEERGYTLEDVRDALLKMLEEPMIEILLKNSNLTPVQFETLLIDVICRMSPDKKLGYEERRKLREKTVSRGAFMRTLKQARDKIRESIYTILLINYLGILDSSFFEDYERLFERLKEYLRSIEDSEKTKTFLVRVEHEITTRIDALIRSL
jgi:hypothetical protein